MSCAVFFIYSEVLMYSSKSVRALVESAMMVALATVLSLVKIVEMPYGGSVTVASMLPVIILAYRHGAAWGLGAGTVYAALQQLLGLNNLSYVTGWQSVLAVIFLDYIIAFAVTGLGGIFRKRLAQRSALVAGSVLVALLRYACHVISGATVWKGLSIPDKAALIYSIGYNATYMLPEAVILIATAYYLGDTVDFSRAVPIRTARAKAEVGGYLPLLANLSFLIGIITDVAIIAPHLQDAETGKFVFSGLLNTSWLAVGIVTATAAAVGIALILISHNRRKA